MAIKIWEFAEADEKKIDELRGRFNLSRLTALALVSRDISDADSAAAFLSGEGKIEDALSLRDAAKGAARVREAIDREERIAVFGDYDVDGIMSAALLCQYLESVGSDTVPVLPERGCTGYGLAKESVDDIEKLGASLIITVDNGISSFEAVAYANEKGIDTIICDHHKVPEVLPAAAAVINPLRADDGSGFKPLAGVGVTMKFAAAIEGCPVEDIMEQFGHFAAIGTVADVVPLVGENRLIVKQGLKQLAFGQNPGLAALIEEVGLDPGNITARDVAFVIAPRLNSAGRMASARTALRMLMTDDPEEASDLAKELSGLNCRRQKTEQEMFASMTRTISENPEVYSDPILVISGDGYSSGVSGIVCSRLVERFGKPAVVISVEGNEARGSGRSVGGFSLYGALCGCKELFISYGGHDLAAGFTMRADRVEELRAMLRDYCGALPEPVPYRRVKLSGIASFGEIDEERVEELERLAPFGAANEEPVFATLGAELTGVSPMGDNHCRLSFKKDGRTLRAALFNVNPGDLTFETGCSVDIAYSLSLYSPPGGRRCVSVKLKGIVPAGFAKEDFGTAKIYDKMCFGQRLSDEDKKLIAPGREDMAAVYRSIKSSPITGGREFICYRFCKMAPGKALAAVKVLRELDLLTEEGGDRNRLSVRETNAKRDLAESAFYAALHAGVRVLERA